MAKSSLSRITEFVIDDISSYHIDAEDALRNYFSSLAPNFAGRFFGYSPSDLRLELNDRLEETDLRSALAVLSRLEAIFRTDYEQRCRKRRKDDISRGFREMYKRRQMKVSLEDEIFEIWRQHSPSAPALISELRGAFKFRHWLAHGRYWTPKLGRRYDYNYIYTLATIILAIIYVTKVSQLWHNLKANATIVSQTTPSATLNAGQRPKSVPL
jgi:hypothetical protein